MSNTTTGPKSENGGGACRSFCWLSGLAIGAYGAFALFTDFSLPAAQAGLYGLAMALIIGAGLRLALCRGRGNRVRERVKQAKISADMAVEKPSIKVSRARSDDSAQPTETQPTETRANAPAPKPARLTPGKTRKAKPETKAERTADADPQEVDDTPTADEAQEAPRSGGDTLVLDAPERAGKGPADAAEADPAEDAIAQKVAQLAEPATETGPDMDDEDSAPKEAEAEGAAADETEPDNTVGDDTAAEEALNESPVAAEKPAPAPIKPLKPKGIDGPEEGAPEDLERLDGLSGDHVQALNRAGIYHLRQFVTMNRRELAWIDENVAGAPGLADGWRRQAIAIGRE